MVTNTIFILLGGLFLIQCVEQPEKVEKPEKLSRIGALVQYYSETEGEGAYAAADRLFRELNNEPVEWYKSMMDDSITFGRFLNDLERKVFVARSSTESVDELESTRQQVIRRLKSLEIPDSYQSLHRRMIQKLESIKPRAIQ